MKKPFRWWNFVILGGWLLTGCQFLGLGGTSMEAHPLGAGFRFSSYAIPGQRIGPMWPIEWQKKLEGAVPQGIWIVGVIYGEGVYVNFPMGGFHHFGSLPAARMIPKGRAMGIPLCHNL